jgi:nucleoside-diphosphate-sugar epimerase
VSAADVVNASLLATGASAASGRTYIVTDGLPYSTRAIYDAMRAALGLPERRWSVPLWAFRAAALAGDAAGRVRGRRMPFSTEAFDKLLGSACYRNDRIRNELGFAPATDLSAALPDIVRTSASFSVRAASGAS